MSKGKQYQAPIEDDDDQEEPDIEKTGLEAKIKFFEEQYKTDSEIWRLKEEELKIENVDLMK